MIFSNFSPPPTPDQYVTFTWFNWFKKIYKFASEYMETLFQRTHISVKEYPFRAKGDGVTDDTAAIQAAIDYASVNGGGKIYFPKGQYLISSRLLISAGDITLIGDGQYASRIAQATVNTGIIYISVGRTQIEKLGFLYTGTPVSGATAIHSIGSDSIFRDILIYGCFIGVEFASSSGQRIQNIQVQNYVSIGIYFNNGCIDSNLDGFILNAGNATNGALGGLRLRQHVEACSFLNGDILNGVYPITIDSPAYAVGNVPGYNNFTNVFFDSGARAAALNKSDFNNFVNCWFSNGRSGAGYAGCEVLVGYGNRFIGCRFFNCGGHGLVIYDQVKYTVITGCAFQDNSITAGLGAAHGLVIAAGTTDFVIQNNSASNGFYPGGQQGYGIIVNAGASDRYILADNLVTGNATGGVFDGGAGVAKRVANNY